MTKKIILTAIVLSALTIFSCSKKANTTSNSTLATTPAAKAQYDASNYGIYKGVFVGSSGTIIVDLSNSGTISATLKIDATTYQFTTTQTLQQNQNTTLNFTNGNDHFTFSVSASGTNPTITNLVINGHSNPALLVAKEVSTALVECFEGTYSGGDQGTFNTIIYNNKLKALTKNTNNENGTADGTITNNQISGTTSGGSTFSGTLNGNNISGTWSNTQSAMSGTWTGTRTY